MKYLSFFTILLFFSCNTASKQFTAQQIIDKTIINSGSKKLENSKITFTFRDKEYSAVRNNGNFELIRSFDSIKDVLSNNGFERFINGNSFTVKEELISKYSNSINSVHYFSVLPFGLNDKAVQKKLLPSSRVKGKDYYKIEVTFSEDGGGEDFEDVFIYWIGKDDFLIDYLAYSYHTNGGGMRFRVLKEQCSINGIRFVDYHNYKPINNQIELTNIDLAFEKDKLTKVSEIVLSNIKVNIF